MQQEVPKSLEEAKAMMESLVEAMRNSLRDGVASRTLEHDTIVDLAYELGSTAIMVKLAAQAGGPRSYASLSALVLIWRAKYEAIHGAD